MSILWFQDIAKMKLAKVAQLVRASARKCGLNKWHMVMSSNPIIDDTLNLPSVGCCGAVSTTRFRSPWRILRAWSCKVPRLSKKKNDIAKTRYLNSELREESDDNTLKKTNVMINLKKNLL